MQTEILRKQTAMSAEKSMMPLPNGEIDKFDLQGLGRTKGLEQLCVYVTLSAN